MKWKNGARLLKLQGITSNNISIRVVSLWFVSRVISGPL